VLLLCGKLASAEAARLAMRCGASDLLPPGPSRAELLEALGRVRVQSMRTETLREPGSIIAVIGAAGGAGASFIASNLAFLIARKESRSAILIDMDLQYAPLSGYLGVRPENSLMKAVERVETLDRMALPGYVGRHPSGVGLVASLPNQELDTGPLPADRFQQLLHLLALQADRVLIDVPRWLDAAATVAVMEANYIVLVLQQTVGNVHNASRLYRMLTRHLGVPKDRIVVVLNRHSRRATVDSEDVERALSIEGVIEMPNDYELVRESLDAAQPLNERRSTIARGLELLSSRIGGPPVEGGGFLRRASTIFRKGDT
jgi:pilus assembly protein CpaE